MDPQVQAAACPAPQGKHGADGGRVPALLAVLLQLAWVVRYWFVCDDGYISWRYGRNLAEGLGLAWNPGEAAPVEGYSEFAWVLLSALTHLIGLGPDPVLPLLSAASGLLLTWRVMRFLARDLVEQPTALLGAALLLGTAVPLGVWSTSGMGTMPALLCLWLFFESLLGSIHRHEGWRAAFAGSALVLLRADGHLWVFLLGGLALAIAQLRRDACLRKAALTAAGLPLLVFLLHTAFRLGYHGDWLPNTARAKVAVSAFTLERGLRYVGSFGLTFPALLLALLVPVAMGRRTLERPTLAAALVVLASVGYSILVGGDFMCFHRFLLPVWPFGAVLFAKGLQALAEDGGLRRTVGLLLAGILPALNALPAFGLEPTPRGLRETCWFRFNARLPDGSMNFRSEHEQWQDMRDRAQAWLRLGEALAEHALPEDKLVYGAIGAVGYASRMVVLDQFGLTRRDVGEFPEVPGERSPGHDRYAPANHFLPEGATIARASLANAADIQRRGTPPPHVRVHPIEPGVVLVLEGFPNP